MKPYKSFVAEAAAAWLKYADEHDAAAKKHLGQMRKSGASRTQIDAHSEARNIHMQAAQAHRTVAQGGAQIQSSHKDQAFHLTKIARKLSRQLS